MIPVQPRRKRHGPIAWIGALLSGLITFVGQVLLIIYLLVSRTILVFAALYLTVYFLASSRPMKGLMQQVISDQIPGTITAASAQWGPLPWQLRIAGGRVFDEHGNEVIRVKAVDATIDLGVTIPGLFGFIADREHNPMRVRFDSVELLEPEALVRVADNGEVNIERAFIIDGWKPHDDDGSPSKPLYFDLTARVVRLLDARGRVDGPGIVATGRGIETVTDFSLTGENHVEMHSEALRLAEAELRVDFVPYRPGALVVPIHDLLVDGFHWDWFGFDFDRARGAFGGTRGAPSGTLDAQDVTLDAAPKIVTWSGGVKVHVKDGAPETAAFTGDLISGPIELELHGKGDIEQVNVDWAASVEKLGLRMGGGRVALDDVSAHGRFLPRGADDSGYYHAVTIDGGEARIGNGRARIVQFFLDAPPLAPDRGHLPRDLALLFDFERIDLAAALPMFVPDVPFELLPLLDGDWTVRGSLTRQHDIRTGGERLELELDEAQIDWHAPVDGLAGDYLLSGAVQYVDDGRDDLLTLERVVLDRGEDRARVAGTIDMNSGQLDIEPYLRVGDVATLARRLGLPQAAGRFVLKGAHASGTIDDPRVSGVLNWTEATLEGRHLQQVTGQVDFSHGLFRILGMRTKNDLGSVSIDGQVRVFDADGKLDSRLAFESTRVEVDQLSLSTLLAQLGPNVKVDVRSQKLTGSLTDPLDTLRGKAHITLRQVQIGDEDVAQIDTDLEADGERLVFKNVKIKLAKGAVVAGDLIVWTRSHKIQGRVDIPPLALGDLGLVAKNIPDFSGHGGAGLLIAGTLEHPTYNGTVALTDIHYNDLALGDTVLALTPSSDGKIAIAADGSFFHGLALESAALTMDGFVPTKLEMLVHANDLELEELVPSAQSKAYDVVANASVHAVFGGETAFEIRAQAGDIRASLRDRNQTWLNTTELVVSKKGEVMHIEPVGIGPRGGDAALQVCGDAGRTIDLALAGQLELVFVPGLAEVFSVTDGRFLIDGLEAHAPQVAGDRRPAEEAEDINCLGAHNAISVRGPAQAPIMTGRLVSQGVVLVPRGTGRELRLNDGSTIVLGPGPSGTQKVELPAGGGLRGELDDGTFAVTGTILTRNLDPLSFDLDIAGADLYVQKPGEFAFTASPHARFEVEGIQSASPIARLSGSLAISEGRYSKSFDTLAQAFGGAVNGRAEAYSGSIFESFPWLARTRLDIDITAADFNIQTALPLARTDLPARLDLSLAGTFENPLLYRRIDLLSGGKLTYFVFERAFQVQSGAIDFDGDPERPVVDVTAQSVITYLAASAKDGRDEDEKDVTITLRMTGRVPDLKIELSSDNSTFDQADIQSLLLTGKPRGDLDRAQESSIVSADISSVLNSVFSAPFVKTASVAVSQQGGLEYRVGTCFAPNLCFDTTTVSDNTETTLKAKFSLSIGDNLVCEGTLRRSETTSNSSLDDTYEARCRYRIPLD